MKDGRRDHEREILYEAFLAGWQAGLGVRVKSPGVHAVIASCFEMWLEEAVDEAEVFGLRFRGREDLPLPETKGPASSVASAAGRPEGRRPSWRWEVPGHAAFGARGAAS